MLLKGFAKFYILVGKITRRAKMKIVIQIIDNDVKRVVFSPDDLFSYETISIGSDVYIGPGARFCSTESSIDIGSKVMFGPGVTIMGGDHNTGEVGRYMYDVKEKRRKDDLPVVIESDCWIAANVTILKGVSIGRGSIVAAGAVVTKSMPPYSVIGGVPARVIRPRFEPHDLERHKKILGELD